MPSPPSHGSFLWKLVCYSLDRKLYPFENEHDRRRSLNSLKLLSSQNSNCINKSVVNGAKRQQPLTLALLGEQTTPDPLLMKIIFHFLFSFSLNNQCGRIPIKEHKVSPEFFTLLPNSVFFSPLTSCKCWFQTDLPWVFPKEPGESPMIHNYRRPAWWTWTQTN